MPRLICLARVVGAVAVFAIVTPSRAALAQDGQGISEGQKAAGEALLASGRAAYRAGNYAEALRSFQQALARLGRPAIYEEIGDAAAKQGEHQRAVDAYHEYLGAISNAPDRAEVEAKIKAEQARVVAAGGGDPDLSPTAAANASDGSISADATGESAQPQRKRSGGELWWLWAGIGAVVVGTVIAAVVVNSSSDPVQPPMRGAVGGTIQTLEAR